jgi:hypothetical protein
MPWNGGIERGGKGDIRCGLLRQGIEVITRIEARVGVDDQVGNDVFMQK